MRNKGIARKAREDRMWAAFERQVQSVLDCRQGNHRVHLEPVEVRFKDGSKLMRYERHNCAYADPLEFLKKEYHNEDRTRRALERIGHLSVAAPSGDLGSAPGGAPRPEGGAKAAARPKKTRHTRQRRTGGSGDVQTPCAAADTSS